MIPDSRGGKIKQSPQFTELDRWIVSAGKFIGNWCALCGYRRALFIFKLKYIGLCPGCVSRRIEELQKKGAELSPDLRELSRETRQETSFQDRKREELFTVKLSPFQRCVRCERLVSRDDVRYRSAERERDGAMRPHCGECVTIARGETKGSS